MEIDWIEGFRIQVKAEKGTAVLSANKEGNKQNPVARRLYESKGFCAIGNEDDDEIELAMTIV